MSNKFKTTWFRASLDTETRSAGLFGNKVERVYNHRSVDMDEFSNFLENAYNQLDREGYDVINVIPVATGSSEKCAQNNGTYVGDVGFSVTRGAVVVGKKRDGKTG